MVRPHQFVAAFAGSFLLGVLVASRFGLDWPAIIIGLALFLILLLLPTQPPIKFLAVAMLGLLLGWWRYGAAVTLPSDLITRWVGQTSGLVGTVANDPVMSGTRQKFYLRVQTVDGQPASGKILLTAWQLPRWEFGDKLQAEVKLALPEVNEEFDYPAYLAKGGVYALGQTASEVQLVDKPRWSWQRELFRLKHWLAHQTQVLVPDPQGMLMNGLLLGMRSSLSDELQTQLKNSGTTHIVALSGFLFLANAPAPPALGTRLGGYRHITVRRDDRSQRLHRPRRHYGLGDATLRAMGTATRFNQRYIVSGCPDGGIKSLDLTI